MKGREPQGIIDPRDFKTVRDELASKLGAIPDDQGRPMPTEAFVPEETYRRVQGIAPDLIVIFGDLIWRAVGPLGYEEIYTFENDTGPDEANHAQYGYYNLIAPGLDTQNCSNDVDILDIAPTMLSLWELPFHCRCKVVFSCSLKNAKRSLQKNRSTSSLCPAWRFAWPLSADSDGAATGKKQKGKLIAWRDIEATEGGYKAEWTRLIALRAPEAAK